MSEADQSFDYMLEVEVADFRERYHHYLFILIVVLAWLTAVRFTLTYNYAELARSNLSTSVCLVATSLLAQLFRRKTVLSLALSLIGLATAVAIETLGHPGSPAVYLFAPVIILVSAVTSTTVLLLSSFIWAGVLIFLLAAAPGSPGNLVAPGLNLLAATVCTGIASRPIFDSLSMALTSAQESIRARDELREQRLQLAHSVKAIDEALYRVSRLNASLIIARQQAEEARQLKVRFANMISHEIRTPLNIIISFSEVIANAPESYGMIEWPASLRDDVTEIYRSGRHLLGLINDVLDLAQIEANRVILKKERGALLDVIDQAVGLAGKWFDHAGLYLRTEVFGDIPELSFDRIRIRQVILNLLSNARHYTASGGVTVRVEGTANDVVVCVRDTGKGISPETLQHLFDEFQHSGETVDQSSGSGLGLSISRMFVGLHGGRMWAESTGTNGGGTAVFFTIPLPATSIAADIPPSQHDVEFWQSRYDQARGERSIMIACDESTTAQMMARMLSNQGKVMTTSFGGLLRDFSEHQPDVALLLTAEDNPHSAMIQQLLEASGDVPIITCELMHRLDVEEHNLVQMTDISAWLLKPITRDDLVAAIYAVAPNARMVLSVEDDLAMARFYDLSIASDKRFARSPTVVNVMHTRDVMPLLDEHLADVILLDLNLADGSGWDVLAQVRARWSLAQLPVIVVTAMDRYGAPVMRAGEIKIHNTNGFSQRQTVLCLQNTLDAVLG